MIKAGQQCMKSATGLDYGTCGAMPIAAMIASPIRQSNKHLPMVVPQGFTLVAIMVPMVTCTWITWILQTMIALLCSLKDKKKKCCHFLNQEDRGIRSCHRMDSRYRPRQKFRRQMIFRNGSR